MPFERFVCFIYFAHVCVLVFILVFKLVFELVFELVFKLVFELVLVIGFVVVVVNSMRLSQLPRPWLPFEGITLADLGVTLLLQMPPSIASIHCWSFRPVKTDLHLQRPQQP